MPWSDWSGGERAIYLKRSISKTDVALFVSGAVLLAVSIRVIVIFSNSLKTVAIFSKAKDMLAITAAAIGVITSLIFFSAIVRRRYLGYKHDVQEGLYKGEKEIYKQTLDRVTERGEFYASLLVTELGDVEKEKLFGEYPELIQFYAGVQDSGQSSEIDRIRIINSPLHARPERFLCVTKEHVYVIKEVQCFELSATAVEEHLKSISKQEISKDENRILIRAKMPSWVRISETKEVVTRNNDFLKKYSHTPVYTAADPSFPGSFRPVFYSDISAFSGDSEEERRFLTKVLRENIKLVSREEASIYEKAIRQVTCSTREDRRDISDKEKEVFVLTRLALGSHSMSSFNLSLRDHADIVADFIIPRSNLAGAFVFGQLDSLIKYQTQTHISRIMVGNRFTARNLSGIVNLTYDFATLLRENSGQNKVLREEVGAFRAFFAEQAASVLHDKGDVVNAANLRMLAKRYSGNWEIITFILTTAIHQSTTVEKVLKKNKVLKELIEKPDREKLRSYIADNVANIKASKNRKKDISIGKLAYYSAMQSLYGAVNATVLTHPDMTYDDFVKMCIINGPEQDEGQAKHVSNYISSYCFDNTPSVARVGSLTGKVIDADINFFDHAVLVNEVERAVEAQDLARGNAAATRPVLEADCIGSGRNAVDNSAGHREPSNSSSVENSGAISEPGTASRTSMNNNAAADTVERRSNQELVGAREEGEEGRPDKGVVEFFSLSNDMSMDDPLYFSADSSFISQESNSATRIDSGRNAGEHDEEICADGSVDPTSVPPLTGEANSGSASSEAQRTRAFLDRENPFPSFAGLFTSQGTKTSGNTGKVGAAAGIKTNAASTSSTTSVNPRGSSASASNAVSSSHKVRKSSGISPSVSVVASTSSGRGSMPNNPGVNRTYYYEALVCNKNSEEGKAASIEDLKTIKEQDIAFATFVGRGGVEHRVYTIGTTNDHKNNYVEYRRLHLPSPAIVSHDDRMRKWVNRNIKKNEIALVVEVEMKTQHEIPEYRDKGYFFREPASGAHIVCKNSDSIMNIMLSELYEGKILESRYALEEYLSFHKTVLEQFVCPDGSVKKECIRHDRDEGFGMLSDVVRNLHSFTRALETKDEYLSEDNKKFLWGVISLVNNLSDHERRELAGRNGTSRGVLYQICSTAYVRRIGIGEVSRPYALSNEASLFKYLDYWSLIRENSGILYIDKNYRSYYFSMVMSAVMERFERGEHGVDDIIKRYERVNEGFPGTVYVAYLIALKAYNMKLPEMDYAMEGKLKKVYCQIKAVVPEFEVEGFSQDGQDQLIKERVKMVRDIEDQIVRNRVKHADAARPIIFLSKSMNARKMPQVCMSLDDDLRQGDLRQYMLQAGFLSHATGIEDGPIHGKAVEAVAYALAGDLSAVLKKPRGKDVLDEMKARVDLKTRVRYLADFARSSHGPSGAELFGDLDMQAIARGTRGKIKLLSIVDNTRGGAPIGIYKKGQPSEVDHSAALDRQFSGVSSSAIAQQNVSTSTSESSQSEIHSSSVVGQQSTSFSLDLDVVEVPRERVELRRVGGADLWYIRCHEMIAKELKKVGCFSCAEEQFSAFVNTGLAIDVYDNLERFKALSKDRRVSYEHRDLIHRLCCAVEGDENLVGKILAAKRGAAQLGYDVKCGVSGGKVAEAVCALSCKENHLFTYGLEQQVEITSKFLYDKNFRNALLKYYLVSMHECCEGAPYNAGVEMRLPAIFNYIPQLERICSTVFSVYQHRASGTVDYHGLRSEDVRRRLNVLGVLYPCSSDSDLAYKDYSCFNDIVEGNGERYSLLFAAKILLGSRNTPIEEFMNSATFSETMGNLQKPSSDRYKVLRAMVERAYLQPGGRDLIAETVADAVLRGLLEMSQVDKISSAPKPIMGELMDKLLNSVSEGKDALLEYCAQQDDTVRSDFFVSLFKERPDIDQVLCVGIGGDSNYAAQASEVDERYEGRPSTELEESEGRACFRQQVRR